MVNFVFQSFLNLTFWLKRVGPPPPFSSICERGSPLILAKKTSFGGWRLSRVYPDSTTYLGAEDLTISEFVRSNTFGSVVYRVHVRKWPPKNQQKNQRSVGIREKLNNCWRFVPTPETPIFSLWLRGILWGRGGQNANVDPTFRILKETRTYILRWFFCGFWGVLRKPIDSKATRD